MINTQWVSNLKTDEERTQFEKYVRNSTSLLQRLTEIIEMEIDRVESTKSDDYDSASWAFKQADRNGQLRAYHKILKLTDLEEQ